MCYEDEYKLYGMSKKLSEEKICCCPVYNDDSEYSWIIAVSPLTKRNDLFYIKIYNNREVNGELRAMWGATKCARINMKTPEYISCDDDGKESWILSKDELNHFLELMSDWMWDAILYAYKNEVSGWDSYEHVIFDREHFPMPDYSKLPTI